MSETPPLEEALRAALGGEPVTLKGLGYDVTAELPQNSVRRALEWLRHERGFNVLVDLTAVDYLRFDGGPEAAPAPHRFRLSYRLMRLGAEDGLVRERLALACWMSDAEGVPSARDLWPNADWLEREVWDMFGLRFSDRPDIRRILMYPEFDGHPLRKDYPIRKRQPLIGPKEDPDRDRMLDADLRPKLL